MFYYLVKTVILGKDQRQTCCNFYVSKQNLHQMKQYTACSLLLNQLISMFIRVQRKN